MHPYKLGEMEQRFADLIWENAPVASGELVKLCGSAFDWKRTTTYTMLKRLCERNIFVNENGTVKVCMTKEEFQAAQGDLFLQENFAADFSGGLFPQEKVKRQRGGGAEKNDRRV